MSILTAFTDKLQREHKNYQRQEKHIAVLSLSSR